MRQGPQPSRFQKVTAAAKRILSLGESGRYEFKRDVYAVTPKLLAALANRVALDPELAVAHSWWASRRSSTRKPGWFTASRTASRRDWTEQSLASRTWRLAHGRSRSDLFIVEEGVSGPAAFLRVEIRPTMPHFDDEGRRQKRMGRSTRAITDDELLRLYLDREAGSFAARFRQTTTELQSAVGAVGGQIDQIAEGIEKHIAEPILRMTAAAAEAADAAHSAVSAADSANAAADTASYEVEPPERLVRNLQEVVNDLEDESHLNLVYRVVQLRRKV